MFKQERREKFHSKGKNCKYNSVKGFTLWLKYLKKVLNEDLEGERILYKPENRHPIIGRVRLKAV